MLYLVGVDHRRAQQRERGAPLTAAQASCADIVRDLAIGKRVSAIAEEECAEHLTAAGLDSVPAAVAAELGLPHVLCDATLAERAALGYVRGDDLEMALLMHNLPQADAFLIAQSAALAFECPKRERFWLERLGELRDADVLFVCGDTHAVTFPILLDAEGVRWEVMARGVGVSDSRFDPVIKLAALGRRAPEALRTRLAQLLGGDVPNCMRPYLPAATGGASAR